MNEYEDYERFIDENEDLIHDLRKNNSCLYSTMDEVIKVLDYIYDRFLFDEKMEDALADIFDIGYGYFSNTLLDIKAYLHDYFNNNMDMLNYYSKLIAYQIYLEDYKYHLESEELLDEERKAVFLSLEDKIDEILKKKLPYAESIFLDFDKELHEIIPARDTFKPVTSVFNLIAEELNIY